MHQINTMVERDQFSRLTGVELLEFGKGTARARMRITPQHLNGVGVVHGGAIFSLADLAFAAACNAHGPVTVAANASISYMKGISEGTLYAEAQEVSRTRRLGTYTVRVTDEAGEVVAIFQGLAYAKKEHWAGSR